jgi:hypothetical protein
VKRLLSLVPIVLLLLVSTSCGNVFFRGPIQTGSTITGSVSILQLSSVVNGTGTVQVTFVTFLQNGPSSTVGFCGDQTGLFPLSQTVRANFNPGQPCATIITVVIII